MGPVVSVDKEWAIGLTEDEYDILIEDLSLCFMTATAQDPQHVALVQKLKECRKDAIKHKIFTH